VEKTKTLLIVFKISSLVSRSVRSSWSAVITSAKEIAMKALVVLAKKLLNFKKHVTVADINL
jgi:CO/xanthine dehydrogenase Mo-binding subunit